MSTSIFANKFKYCRKSCAAFPSETKAGYMLCPRCPFLFFFVINMLFLSFIKKFGGRTCERPHTLRIWKGKTLFSNKVLRLLRCETAQFPKCIFRDVSWQFLFPLPSLSKQHPLCSPPILFFFCFRLFLLWQLIRQQGQQGSFAIWTGGASQMASCFSLSLPPLPTSPDSMQPNSSHTPKGQSAQALTVTSWELVSSKRPCSGLVD